MIPRYIDDLDTTFEYLKSLPLIEALWWFIENIEPEHPHRTSLFSTCGNGCGCITPASSTTGQLVADYHMSITY